MRHFNFIVIILLTCCFTVRGEELWKNPVVIGASVSDGYDHKEIYGGERSEKLSLEHYLNELIVAPHGKITNTGNRLFFLRPHSISDKQVINAKKMKPSVVLSPDYLFWLVYGNLGNEEQRIQAFKSGLRKLEEFSCPIVVGNIPDATKAIHRMLSAKQVPQLDTIAKVNKLLSEWAAKRNNVAVVDFANFMKKSVNNDTIKLKHLALDKGTTRDLLQTDFLHPTARGARAVCYALLECLQTLKNFPDQDIDWKGEKARASSVPALKGKQVPTN